ncbi:DUF2927 domain-containing protein [Jannaschia seohaensis]|uniref:ATP-dependent transcriptional regulator n=1 Tax=Jannaschia seohaensis TaxID=475081 RepID=A0A2Y9C8X6_9RHOB|nr:DUF2927 domain-containing protein [Jannaschia seohaensis]PWJ13297.1 Protein of unknown function (DUF2927) [Jannaschia seohaensis]SSA50623.1 Protein of unknown function [Jannaschia seohaensis]
MMLRGLILAGAVALASCTPADAPPVASRAGIVSAAALPPAHRFTGVPQRPIPVQPNGQLARDFMALSFQLETGRQLPVFTRFEGPITVGVEGEAPSSLDADLDALIARLRTEARIDVSRAGRGEMPSITVSALPRKTLQSVVPGAACFVVPRVTGWQDYLDRRFSNAVDWTTLKTRTRASIFLPGDVSAQEIRDCLHEELAQALGPLNDLYRLPHSVFNDDNVHVVLTSYDMMLLRATYDPALRSGMSQEEIAAVLPKVMARVNPAGRRPDRAATVESPDDWTRSIRGALSPAGSSRNRLAQAERAVAIATDASWRDSRLPFAQLALGRAALSTDADRAIAAFLAAGTGFRRLYGDGIHAAHVAVQLAAFALTAGQPESTLRIVDRALPAARDAQNAGITSTLLMIRSQALAMRGAAELSQEVRSEAISWGRYAWGDRVLARRLAEIDALSPAS